MTDLNKVFLIGRITRDITEQDFSYIKTGTAKLTLSIACNRSQKSGDEWKDIVSYFDIVIWGKMAESLKKFVAKGKRIGMSGQLVQDRWIDQNGNNRSKVYIVAEEVQLLDGGTKNSEQSQQVAEENGFPEDLPF